MQHRGGYDEEAKECSCSLRHMENPSPLIFARCVAPVGRLNTRASGLVQSALKVVGLG